MMDKIETAAQNPIFMFSGQGSQKSGMGEDILGFSAARDVFTCASDTLCYDVIELIKTDDAEKLNETQNAQVVIATLSLALTQVLAGRGITPAATLGFSLGQITALPVAGMLSLEQTFELIKVRSELMAEASREYPGSMCALLGADEESVLKLCEEQSQDEVLVPANYNSPGQIVIAGDKTAVERAQQSWSDQKKRSAMLATSGAFHTPLMQRAATQLRDYLETVEFSDPRIPLISNVDSKPMTKDAAIDQLTRHLTTPVYFYQSVEALKQAGATHFVEIGFGGVLFGLLKRIDKELERSQIHDKQSLEMYIADVSSDFGDRAQR